MADFAPWKACTILRQELDAAGEHEWSQRLREASGAGMGHEIYAAVRDALSELRHTDIARRLGLQTRINDLIVYVYWYPSTGRGPLRDIRYPKLWLGPLVTWRWGKQGPPSWRPYFAGDDAKPLA